MILPQKSESSSRVAVFAAAVTLVISALNGFVAFHGWSSAKDIREVAEQSKDKQKAIDQVLEGSYFLYARAVEREVSELVAELPGIDLTGSHTQEIKDAIRKVRDNLALLEQQVKSENRLPTRHLVEGFIALDSKNCTSAIQSLNAYAKESPVKYHLLGIAYTKCGQLDQADGAYRKVLEISPFRPTDRLKAKAVSNLGNNDVRRKDFQSALGQYDRALRIDPATYGVYFNKAAALSLSGRYPEAMKALCEYGKRHDAPVVKEMESERDLDGLKAFLGKEGGDWKTRLIADLAKDCG